MRLEGKVALISGGARGMGAVEAKLFAHEGASVVIGDILEAEGRAVESDIQKAGGKAVFVRLDVTSEADWQRAVALAEQRFGKLDVLVNNAGVSTRGRLEDVTGEEWDRVMAINAKGVFLGTKTAIPALRRAGGGSIVNISSISGIVAIYGTPNVAYAASKFAVRGITKQIAIEYGKQGIRANSVHPGYIRTPMMTAALDDEQIKIASGSVPIGRVGEVEDVSNLVVFLASDESGFVTGTEHIIDGGLTAL